MKEKCRGCGKILRRDCGVYDPDTGERAKPNFYGGYVCNRNCDEKVCLAMSSSMPGAGPARLLNSLEREQVDRNWGG